MKKFLLLTFTLSLTLFYSSNVSGQSLYLSISKTDISCSNSTGSATVSLDPDMLFFQPTPPFKYQWSNGATGNSIDNLSPGTYTVTFTDAIGLTEYGEITINDYSKLKAICVQTNSSCNGASLGNATVAVKNGSGSYTYSWNTNPVQTTQSVTGLTEGIYTVTVKDNTTNCIITGDVTIKLTPSTPVGDPAVYGDNQWNIYAWNEGTRNNIPWENSNTYSGFFTANTLDFNSENYWEDYSIPSAVPGYQGCQVNGDNHSWSAKRQGFPCGYYKIDIPMHDDWGELYIDGLLVWNHKSCCDSHLNVWQGYLNANSKVEFRIAEDGGQSRGNIKFNLIEPEVTITNVTCNGGNDGAISITPETVGTFTYDWGNGVTTKDRTGLTAGDYTVLITNPVGCIKSKTFSITEPATIDLTVSLSNGILTANQSGATYKWYDCANNLTVGTNSSTFAPTQAGNYKVDITVGNCTKTSDCISFTSLGISETVSDSKFIVYPNPSKGIINILSESDGDFKIINQLGQTIKTFKIEANVVNTVQLQNLSNGTYFLKNTNNHKSSPYKLLIVK